MVNQIRKLHNKVKQLELPRSCPWWRDRNWCRHLSGDVENYAPAADFSPHLWCSCNPVKSSQKSLRAPKTNISQQFLYIDINSINDCRRILRVYSLEKERTRYKLILNTYAFHSIKGSNVTFRVVACRGNPSVSIAEYKRTESSSHLYF